MVRINYYLTLWSFEKFVTGDPALQCLTGVIYQRVVSLGKEAEGDELDVNQPLPSGVCFCKVFSKKSGYTLNYRDSKRGKLPRRWPLL